MMDALPPFAISNDDVRFGADAVPAADLVRDLLAGQEGAWREFHRRYDALIYSCIHKVASRRGASNDAGDIYATFLLTLLANDMAKIRAFDPARGVRLGSWIGMLATNAAWDYLRNLRREPMRASIEELDTMRCGRPSALEVLELRERLEQVGSILAKFSEKDRELLALSVGEGLGPEQIADRLGISVKTVHSKRHKIKLRLEARLGAGRLAA